MSLIYKLPNKSSLVFSNEVLEHFKSQKQRLFQNERGGILFARFDDSVTRVCLAQGPFKSDLMKAFQFRANKKRAQKDIDNKFEQGLHYIGEWHTHPQKTPLPSSDDKAAIVDCFNKSTHELENLILVIVGQNDFPQGLWVGVSNGQSISELSAV